MKKTDTKPLKAEKLTRAAANGRSHRKLTHVAFYRLCEWLKRQEFAEPITLSMAADKATGDLGYPVAPGSVGEACAATGVRLPVPPQTAQDRTDQCLDRLAAELVEFRKELRCIAEVLQHHAAGTNDESTAGTLANLISRLQ